MSQLLYISPTYHSLKNVKKMESEQSVSERIIVVLREINGTTKDLSGALEIDENYIRVVMNRMVKNGVIIHTGRFINRYKLYRLAKPEELEMNINCEKYRDILIKIILPFAKSGIKVELLPSEQEKIRELFQANYHPSGEKKNGTIKI